MNIREVNKVIHGVDRLLEFTVQFGQQLLRLVGDLFRLLL